MQFSDKFVQAVGDGIREYNMRQPARMVTVDESGEVDPPTRDEQAVIDEEWLDAVRYGLAKAAEVAKS